MQANMNTPVSSLYNTIMFLDYRLICSALVSISYGISLSIHAFMLSSVEFQSEAKAEQMSL